MDPHDYWTALRRRWITIVALGLVGGGAAYGYASTLSPSYRSTSSVFVSSTQGQTTTELVQGSTFSQNLVQSYAQLATTPAVLEPVIARLGLEVTPTALARSVTVDTPLNTVIIDVSVTDSSPEQAARLSDAVSDSLADVAGELAPESAGGDPSIALTTVAEAQVPRNPISPNTRLIALTGILAGLALGVVYALARQILDTRIRTERDVERVTEAPVIGSVERRDRADGVTLLAAPHSAAAEGYRRIRTNLEFADVDTPIRSIAVTSALPGEGKTTTAVNLALALGEHSDRVLLVDADLRRPTVADQTGLEGVVGLTTVLVGAASIEDAVQPWASGVHVLTSGSVPPNPNQLLGSAAMASLMADLTARYEFVVLDSPPILPAADALTLAHLTDGALLVTRVRTTRRAQLAEAADALDGVNARTLGVVLTRVAPSRHTTYYGPVSTDGAPVATSMPTAVSAPATAPAPADPTAGVAASPTPDETTATSPQGAITPEDAATPAVDPAAEASSETAVPAPRSARVEEQPALPRRTRTRSR
ncbi:polysaccharide biosynthesis tyrosine autokinase [Clavibacter sp. MX14-G9D]|uniref:polysaccharide biosynthesis tyrosine autokinase n=1 Tax=Clavibacter sp. MX14-G9D TaxID=3064656 RepID=UPI00293E7BB9|nr:polysaccharide biosynthesis tyrosine autokinase [Clavibacter sp. MX14-G9D]